MKPFNPTKPTIGQPVDAYILNLADEFVHWVNGKFADQVVDPDLITARKLWADDPLTPEHARHEYFDGAWDDMREIVNTVKALKMGRGE